MNLCLACGSEDVQTREVQLLRVNVRTMHRLELKKLVEIHCNDCSHSYSSDEMHAHPSAAKGLVPAL
jgi:predicted nucleic-acid-binding Zn-ribbon protein